MTSNQLIVTTGTGLANYAQLAAADQALPLEMRLSEWLGKLTPKTREAYQGEIRRFALWIGATTTGQAIEALAYADRLDKGPRPTLRMLERYRDAQYGDGSKKKSSSVGRSIAALNSCLAMLDKAGIGPGKQAVAACPSNVVKGSRAGPRQQTASEMLGRLERANTAKAARDLAILRLLLQSGLRRGEVVSMSIADVDAENCQIRILGKARRVQEWAPMGASTCGAIQAWLLHRAAIAVESETALFVSVSNNRGRGISGHAIANLVTAAAAGIVKDGETVRPHGMRHCAVTAVLKGTKDVRVASHFARHKNIQTTIAAYDDSAVEAAREAVDLLNTAF